MHVWYNQLNSGIPSQGNFLLPRRNAGAGTLVSRGDYVVRPSERRLNDATSFQGSLQHSPTSVNTTYITPVSSRFVNKEGFLLIIPSALFHEILVRIPTRLALRRNTLAWNCGEAKNSRNRSIHTCRITIVSGSHFLVDLSLVDMVCAYFGSSEDLKSNRAVRRVYSKTLPWYF